jgi:hypothetical protein
MLPTLSLVTMIWAQAPPPQGHAAQAQAAIPSIPNWLAWLYVFGEQSVTVPGYFGAVVAWVKIVGLFCLLAWVVSWVIAAFKEPSLNRSRLLRLLDVSALAAVVGAILTTLLRVLEVNGRIPLWRVARIPLTMLLALICAALVFVWLETRLWSAIRRIGTKLDLFVLAALHLAIALGIVVALMVLPRVDPTFSIRSIRSWQEIVTTGARLGGTYMGLVVLVRVILVMIPEVLAIRFRRLYSIAWHCWVESFRRMWAPWVVVVVFGVILAFTSWFLKPPRDAELGRLYVGTLALLCSLLMTVTVGILAPISIPNDIRQQTIYTVVSKPTRRLELIWGRMLGYMALVTVLLLFFGGVSLIYVDRMVGSAIAHERALADQEQKKNHLELARTHREAAEQLQTRLSARVPVRGYLTFIDSRNQLKRSGIDVGQELDYRSFVEGATPSRAIWQFGDVIPDAFGAPRKHSRPVPLSHLLPSGTIEGLENEIADLEQSVARARNAQASAVTTTDLGRVSGDITATEAQIKRLQVDLAGLKDREKSLQKTNRAAAARLHAKPIVLDMTFNIYRTTKGEIGEPVYAALKVINRRDPKRTYERVLPIREYYNNTVRFDPSYLVGSAGDLAIEVRCLSPNQYLGMAESDLFILADQGGFELNFMKGLFGIWLQAMVLTAIGVWAGTFLSWPVALLTTIGFFVGGQIGFGFLQQFALEGLIGGGPFESLIRLLSHDNQVSDLAPTVAVVLAKTLDQIVMPVMSRLVYVVPNFSALDLSNIVSEGFAVTWGTVFSNLMLAVAYALPFSIAGYFIMKNREVAA